MVQAALYRNVFSARMFTTRGSVHIMLHSARKSNTGHSPCFSSTCRRWDRVISGRSKLLPHPETEYSCFAPPCPLPLQPHAQIFPPPALLAAPPLRPLFPWPRVLCLRFDLHFCADESTHEGSETGRTGKNVFACLAVKRLLVVINVGRTAHCCSHRRTGIMYVGRPLRTGAALHYYCLGRVRRPQDDWWIHQPTNDTTVVDDPEV